MRSITGGEDGAGVVRGQPVTDLGLAYRAPVGELRGEMGLLFVEQGTLRGGQRACLDELRRHAAGQQRFPVVVLLTAAREAKQLGLQLAYAVDHSLGVVEMGHVRPDRSGQLSRRIEVGESSFPAAPVSPVGVVVDQHRLPSGM